MAICITGGLPLPQARDRDDPCTPTPFLTRASNQSPAPVPRPPPHPRRTDDGARPAPHQDVVGRVHAIADGAISQPLLPLLQLLQQPKVPRHCRLTSRPIRNRNDAWIPAHSHPPQPASDPLAPTPPGCSPTTLPGGPPKDMAAPLVHPDQPYNNVEILGGTATVRPTQKAAASMGMEGGPGCDIRPLLAKALGGPPPPQAPMCGRALTRSRVSGQACSRVQPPSNTIPSRKNAFVKSQLWNGLKAWFCDLTSAPLASMVWCSACKADVEAEAEDGNGFS